MLKRLGIVLALVTVLSSCSSANEEKEIDIAIDKACKTIVNVSGGVSVSGGASAAFAELARLDARYLPLLISFSDWWQSQPRAIDTQGPAKYPPFPDALLNFCKE